MDWDKHYANRDQLPVEELARYFGKHVAWSLDGKRILASGNDDGEVLQAVREAGMPIDEVVLSYVPSPDETLIGGLFVEPDGGQAE
jgi:hypothetical protein